MWYVDDCWMCTYTYVVFDVFMWFVVIICVVYVWCVYLIGDHNVCNGGCMVGCVHVCHCCVCDCWWFVGVDDVMLVAMMMMIVLHVDVCALAMFVLLV